MKAHIRFHTWLVFAGLVIVKVSKITNALGPTVLTSALYITILLLTILPIRVSLRIVTILYFTKYINKYGGIFKRQFNSNAYMRYPHLSSANNNVALVGRTYAFAASESLVTVNALSMHGPYAFKRLGDRNLGSYLNMWNK